MHRVELKVVEEVGSSLFQCYLKFLMHRVELKEVLSIFFKICLSVVPNAPCGVERWEKQALRNLVMCS